MQCVGGGCCGDRGQMRGNVGFLDGPSCVLERYASYWERPSACVLNVSLILVIYHCDGGTFHP